MGQTTIGLPARRVPTQDSGVEHDAPEEGCNQDRFSNQFPSAPRAYLCRIFGRRTTPGRRTVDIYEV